VRRLLATGLASIVMTSLAAVPAAGARCPETTLADIEKEVMCPVCGVPLGLAEAPQAERERAFIQSLIDRCRSKQEIERALTAEYGPGILALPEDDGFNVAAYLVPALAMLAASLGLALGLVAWRRKRRRIGSDDPPLAEVPPLDPAALARLDAELQGHDR
jgi:cytochrome c-type biogenesis protein CcmH